MISIARLLVVFLFCYSGLASAGVAENLTSLEKLAHSQPQTASMCVRQLKNWNQEFAIVSPLDLKSELTKTPSILRRFFGLQQAMNAMIKGFDSRSIFSLPDGADCLAQIRQTLVTLRSAEDELLLAQTLASREQALQGGFPQLLSAKEDVRLRSGDVLLSRGNAFVSAAIAGISQEESQFSHLTQVYIDAPAGTEITAEAAENDPRVYTIEAHIEVGSFTRPFKNYVKDGNARVVQYRSNQSPEQAHAAARFIFEKVRAYQLASMKAAGRTSLTVNDNPPYDFQMNLGDSTEIFCAEIISLAYGSIGLKVPRFPSELRANDVTRRLGITAQATFAPADIEVDPNFELLAEWRDLRKLAATKTKDVVFASIYDWMSRLDYAYHPSTSDEAKAFLAWTVRQSDAAYLDRLPKNMSTTAIAMTFVLDRVGETLEAKVNEAIASYARSHKGLRPSERSLLKGLESFRAYDLARFRNGYGTAFHWDLR